MLPHGCPLAPVGGTNRDKSPSCLGKPQWTRGGPFVSVRRQTGTKGSLLMPKTFCPGWATNRDRRASTWPLWLAQAGGPFVPVGATNRGQRTSTRQHFSGWVFVFFKGGVRGFGRVNLGVSYIVLAS